MFAVDVTVPLPPGPLRLQLRSGARVVGVAGASGAGKTTLLRVLAGLDRRATGSVSALGEVWQAPGRFVEPWARGVGWVPQEALVFPHLSVAENLHYGGGEPGPLVELLGLGELLARRTRNLSGGERQRVALGRAMGRAPRLLLLDEPFSALDRALRERVRAGVAAWCAERALPVVLVSHDEGDLTAFGAEMWRLEGGVLASMTPP